MEIPIVQSTSMIETSAFDSAPPAAPARPPLAESAAGRFLDRLAIASARRVLVVPTEEVDWIEAEGNYVRVHRGETSHLLRETMKRLELVLDPSQFARVHRSAFVRLDRVREIVRTSSGGLHLELTCGERLALSRNYRRGFLDALFPGVETAELERFESGTFEEPSPDPSW
ncbi:MAG: LytR/AlgR family response regulator transcription factor [Thermoanaerobaculia bacterium]